MCLLLYLFTSDYLLFAYTLLTTKIEPTRMSDLPSQGLSPEDSQTSQLVENDNGEAVVAVKNDYGKSFNFFFC